MKSFATLYHCCTHHLEIMEAVYICSILVGNHQQSKSTAPGLARESRNERFKDGRFSRCATR